MKLLILGGTADARAICTQLHAAGPHYELVYSVAGLVRQPQVPATVVSGGFKQLGGLTHFCQAQNIAAIVDATHPYTTTMGNTAKATSQQLSIPYWRFLRPAWQTSAGDQWRSFANSQQLLTAMQGYQRILLTLGQVSQDNLAIVQQVPQVWLRTAAKPSIALPNNVQWIKAIGPFDLADERTLLATHQIQAMASKNSGGQATSPKLTAAREQDIPVYMLQRPQQAGTTYAHIEHLLRQVQIWQETLKVTPMTLIAP